MLLFYGNGSIKNDINTKFLNNYLFADAEVGEDFAEDVVGGDFAGDFAEPVEAFAYVLVEEVAAEAVVQAVDGAGDGVAGTGQGLVMAGVGDDDGVAGYVGQGCGLDDEVAQGLDVAVAFGTDRHNGDSFGQGAFEFAPCGNVVVKVGLVEHGNQLLAVAMCQDIVGHAGVSTGDINHPEHDVGLVDSLPCPLDAHLFDGVARLAYACRVDEAEQDAAHNDGVFDGVACGAVDVAHQRAIITQQCIQ